MNNRYSQFRNFKIILFKIPDSITRPACQQVYNMFHPSEPVAARLEPLISARFSILPPVNVSRYAKYPLGNGQPYHLRKYLFTKKRERKK